MAPEQLLEASHGQDQVAPQTVTIAIDDRRPAQLDTQLGVHLTLTRQRQPLVDHVLLGLQVEHAADALPGQLMQLLGRHRAAAEQERLVDRVVEDHDAIVARRNAGERLRERATAAVLGSRTTVSLHDGRWRNATLALLAPLLACGGSGAPSQTPLPAASDDPQAPAPSAEPPSAAPTASVRPAPPPAPRVPLVELGSWTLELDQRAKSIALGKRRVAALTGESLDATAVWMRDAGVWRELAFPVSLLPKDGAHDAAWVWFGRDDRPRVMGFRQDGVVQRQLYWRWKGNWRGRPGEIGRLDAEPPAALFGILGHDDPEVVCKQGDTCIIKRLSGWTYIPSPDQWHAVAIAGGSAFAVGHGSALRIDDGDQGWRPISDEVPWKHPESVTALAGGRLWVSTRGEVHHWDGSRWSSAPSPLAESRGIWARAADDVWLTGKKGIAHFDGSKWYRLATPIGSFRAVTGTSDEVWVAGYSGVWVGRGM